MMIDDGMEKYGEKSNGMTAQSKNINYIELDFLYGTCHILS